MEIDFQPLGDKGVRVGFKEEIISPEVNKVVRTFHFALEQEEIPGVEDIVPTYTSLTIYYRPDIISYGEMVNRLKRIENKLGQIRLPQSRLIEIPVLYNQEKGPDLSYVAQYNNLDIEEVIRLHTKEPYLVYMLGFTPGFPYLGGLVEELTTPRLENPRSKIAGGSVGIGGSQTGIYSVEAPGGWRIIGHTPVKLYDSHRKDPVLLKAGDYLKFKSVEKEEYEDIKKEVKKGIYQLNIKKMRSDNGGINRY